METSSDTQRGRPRGDGMKFSTQETRRAYLYGALTAVEAIRSGERLGDVVNRLPAVADWVDDGGHRPEIGPLRWKCADCGWFTDWRPSDGRGWCDYCGAERDMGAA